MQVHGRDIGFMCTVAAHHKISALDDSHDLNAVLAALSSADLVEQYVTAVLFTAAMSEGYEANRKWNDPEYTPAPLTVEELENLTRVEFDALFEKAFDTFMKDIGVTVEAEEPKGKNAEAAGDERSS